MTLDTSLAQLESAQLLFRARGASQIAATEYVFKHVLVREAAYESLLKQERRQLHLAVGEVIELLFKHQTDEYSAILGRHFDEANDIRAIDYYVKAAEMASRRHATVEAIELYSHAIDFARRLNIADVRVIEIYLKRGRQMELSGQYTTALSNYAEAEKIADEKHNDAMLLKVLLAFGTLHSAPSPVTDVEKARLINARALALAQKINDKEAEARVYWNETLRCKFSSEYHIMVEHGTRAIALARELNLKELLAYTLNDIYPSYLLLGESKKARMVLQEARGLWQELGNLPMLTDTLTNIAELQLLNGESDEGIVNAREALRISTVIGNAWGQGYSQLILGEFLYSMGQVGEAMRTLKASCAASRAGGFSVGEMASLFLLAHAYADMGAYERGYECAQASITAIAPVPTWKPFALAGLVYVQLSMGDRASAEQTLTVAKEGLTTQDLSTLYVSLAEVKLSMLSDDYDAMLDSLHYGEKVLEKFGANRYLAELYYFQGEVFRLKHDYENAYKKLKVSFAMCTTFIVKQVLWKVLFAMSLCAEKLGLGDESRRMCDEACAVIWSIAETIDEDALRTGFLARKDVMEVLTAGAK
jgi:tetratricopeptide (TPR) repeat protein